jgi:HSP20 family molecular chaperone IbpA
MKVYNYTTTDIDSIFNTVFNHEVWGSAYPHTNVIEVDKHRFLLQIALAGHKKEQIKLSVNNDHLILEVDKVVLPEGKVLRRDIAGRSIKTSYKLNGLEVDGVKFEDGLLLVELKVPEEKKPRVIEF